MIPTPPARTAHPSAKIAVAVVGVAVLLSLMVIAFALPAVKSSMHDVPLGVVGTSQQAQQLEKAASGFVVTPFIDETDARQAILHRQVYGAVVFGDTQITTFTATAASPPVAALIPVLGQKIAAVTGLPAHTEDLRSFPAADPKGVGLAAGAMPLALGGWIGAMVIMLLVPSLKGRLIATGGVAVVAGLALVATLQFAIGTFDGNFWLTWLAGILGIAATCCAVLGLRELFGGPGLAVAAVLLIFLGNPLSGLASAPEMLPRPWGAIGQLLPPGATGVLLRDVVFFDGHGATHSLVVLTAWLLGGLALYFAAVRRDTTTAQVDVDEVHIGHHQRDVPAQDDTAIGDSMRRTARPHPADARAWGPPPSRPPYPAPVSDHPRPQKAENDWRARFSDGAPHERNGRPAPMPTSSFTAMPDLHPPLRSPETFSTSGDDHTRPLIAPSVVKRGSPTIRRKGLDEPHGLKSRN